jgi:hypothetical protein
MTAPQSYKMARKLEITSLTRDEVQNRTGINIVNGQGNTYELVRVTNKDKVTEMIIKEKDGVKRKLRTGKKTKWERLCDEKGCYKQDSRTGKCFSHGGGYQCAKEGCDTAVKTEGKLCILHGRISKPCSHDGCELKVRLRGLCNKHGGYPMCAHRSCEEKAITSSPMCKEHTSEKVLEERRAAERVYMKKIKDENPSFRIMHAHRTYLYGFLSKEATRAEKMTEHRKLIGGDRDKVRAHVQSLFKDGMTWENYGEWEFDHIIPWSLFDLTNQAHKEVCLHYLNIQPLWNSANRSKKDELRLDMVSDELAKMFIRLEED